MIATDHRPGGADREHAATVAERDANINIVFNESGSDTIKKPSAYTRTRAQANQLVELKTRGSKMNKKKRENGYGGRGD